MDLKKFEFWFVTGSQHLYGEEVLAQVAEHSKIMTDWMDQQAALPGRLVNKGVVATPDQITDVMTAASQDKKLRWRNHLDAYILAFEYVDHRSKQFEKTASAY